MKKERYGEASQNDDYTAAYLSDHQTNKHKTSNYSNLLDQMNNSTNHRSFKHLTTSTNQDSNQFETNLSASLRSFDHLTSSLSTSPNQTSLYRPHSSNESSTHSNGELCDKIRHFTEEFKEKFIKKRTSKSVNLFKKSESTNSSSDQEEYKKCVTRIKINTNDDSDFLNLSNSDLMSDQSSSNLCDSKISQNSLTESRSPFINRALPPLPGKEKFARCSFDKASNSRSSYGEKSDDRNLKDKFNEEPNERTRNFNECQADSQENSDDGDCESNATNCFKIYRDKNVKSKSSKLQNLRNHLLSSNRMYPHPPPHLQNRLNARAQQFDYEDEDDENNSNQTNTQTSSGSSLINLNSNLIHHSGTAQKLFASNNSSFRDNDESGNYFGSDHSSKVDKQSADEHAKRMMDYAESIEKVKDQPWYWGPLSGEKAEKLLQNEPEGSFIVRDSSDENYIFSLTFKLNADIIHVRIEHDQGSFSFGALQKFSSSTIVDFIHEIVEYSRSGRYLFFLHRLPVIGPMRVQLLNPVSRFRNIQSLKHLSRFIILKHVRRDLISSLPLPDKLIKYLNEHNYFAEIK